MNLPALRLLPAKEESVKRAHPWIFSGALAPHDLAAGTWAELHDHNGQYLGTGFTEPGSIAFKWVGKERLSPEDFLRTRLQEAHLLRRSMGMLNRADLEIYRLFFAEGDGLPGLVIDIYGGHAVVQLHSKALLPYTAVLTEILVELGYSSVYLKSRESLHDQNLVDAYLHGERQATVFLENGIPFQVDWEGGQKTGFFIDQRNNRQKVRELAEGKKVLNAFSYTGGFSSYALMGGATEVVSLDSSKKAIQLAESNAELLNFSGIHTGVSQDAFDYLKEMPDHFDLVILDPPAFAKNQRARHKAVQAYKRINAMAMKRMRSGTWLLTFSCSQHISRELFVSTVRAAAIESRKQLRLIEHLQQPADHPSSLLHPEGEYLKGLLLQIR